MPNNAVYTKEFAVKLYETMCTIRKFEECVKHDFLAGEIPGFTHSYIGEEAIATGVCAALRDDDVIESTHRGHGHCVAKGADVNRMMAEIFGKETGLCKGLTEAGWAVDCPKASMYIWARIPEPYRALGSLEFARQLLDKAKVCVSPGIGFGDQGDEYVRFALIENEARIRQAVRGIRGMFKADGLLKVPAAATAS